MIAKQELEEAIRDIGTVKITLSDGYSYDVGDAENWVGGRPGFFMSDLMGNVLYTQIGTLVTAIYAFLAKDGRFIEEMDY